MSEDAKKGEPEGNDRGEEALPPLDFSSFILSLSTSVLISLGVVENPVTKKVEKDPRVARQTIDLIALLKEKTRGNLTEDEARLMEEVLRDLRIWYVKASA